MLWKLLFESVTIESLKKIIWMFFWPWHYLLAKLCNHLIEIRNMPKCTPGCTYEHTLMPGAWANMLLPWYMCDVLLMFSFICKRAYIHLLFAKFLRSFIWELIFVQYSTCMHLCGRTHGCRNLMCVYMQNISGYADVHAVCFCTFMPVKILRVRF